MRQQPFQQLWVQLLAALGRETQSLERKPFLAVVEQDARYRYDGEEQPESDDCGGSDGLVVHGGLPVP